MKDTILEHMVRLSVAVTIGLFVEYELYALAAGFLVFFGLDEIAGLKGDHYE